MKNFKFGKVMALTALLTLSGQIAAQGFLKKLQKATEKVTETVNTAIGNETAEAAADTATAKKINWEALPVYKAQQVYELTAEGDTVKNEDGTARFIVILVDQFGNRRTPETVKAQQKKVNDAIAKILVKVGGGALLGGIASKDAKGALVGAGAGALASIDDIKQAKRWKKVLNQQKKLLEAYNKNFTDEGTPKDSKVDPSSIEDLNLDKSEIVSASTEKIKEQSESAKNYDMGGDEALNF